MSFTAQDLVGQTERLRKFALKLCGNSADADDLLQNTVLRGLEKQDLFMEGTDLGKWLSKVMFNLFVSDYRRKVKFETQYDVEDLINNRAVAAAQMDHMALRQVDDAMATLSADHRAILISVCVKGMKYEEVAEILNIPVGTVRSRLFRARENLKLAMEDKQSGYKPSGGGENPRYVFPETGTGARVAL